MGSLPNEKYMGSLPNEKYMGSNPAATRNEKTHIG